MPILSETRVHDSAVIIQTWWRSISQRKTPLSWEDDVEEEEENCPICLSHIDSKDVCVTECNHKFHLKCILQSTAKTWGNSNCPLCRNILLPQNTHLGSSEEPAAEESDFLEFEGQEFFADDVDLYFSADLSEETLFGEHTPVNPEEDNQDEPDWTAAHPQMVEAEMTQHQIHVCTGLMMDAFERARTIQETTHRTEMEEAAIRQQSMYDNGFREGRSAADQEIKSLREQINTAQAEIIRLLKEKIDEKKNSKL